jgi:hypothetical protein
MEEGPLTSAVMFKKSGFFMGMEQLKYAIELCGMLRRAAPNCFHRLYESDMHCIYSWEPKLSCHPIATVADVAGIIETCGNDETCICKKLKKLSDKLSPR